MQLEALNALGRRTAEQTLLRCCGSERWAREMAATRPWPTPEAMGEAADTVWRRLETADYLQAFAAHPRIGEPNASDDADADPGWSSAEQSGVATASVDVLGRLALANEDYQTRFGFIFIICATGKSADEMLEIVEARLQHSREEELRIAAEEQRKITRLRLNKLVSAT